MRGAFSLRRRRSRSTGRLPRKSTRRPSDQSRMPNSKSSPTRMPSVMRSPRRRISARLDEPQRRRAIEQPVLRGIDPAPPPDAHERVRHDRLALRADPRDRGGRSLGANVPDPGAHRARLEEVVGAHHGEVLGVDECRARGCRAPPGCAPRRRTRRSRHEPGCPRGAVRSVAAPTPWATTVTRTWSRTSSSCSTEATARSMGRDSSWQAMTTSTKGRLTRAPRAGPARRSSEPWRRARRSVPRAAIVPSCMKQIRSLSRIVESRWATETIVTSPLRPRIAAVTSDSVFVSSALVASSSTSTSGSL